MAKRLKAGLKAKRQAKKRYLKNRVIKETLKQKIKEYLKVRAEGGEKAEKALPEIFSLLDKAVKKGIIHKNKASRKKSKLSKIKK